MSNCWCQEYGALTEFVGGHPEIKIMPGSISVPQNVRPDFYHLLNTSIEILVKENFSELLGKSEVLSRNYLAVEKELIELLNLCSVVQPKPLYWFLLDPLDGFRRELLDLSFDLLKGKLDIAAFEKKAEQNIKAFSGTFFISGYKKWVILTLIKLLQADTLYQVALRPIERSGLAMITEEGRGTKDTVPNPQISKDLSFEHGHAQLFIVPDCIVHSSRTDRYVAFRSERDNSILTATNASRKRVWYPIDFITQLNAGSIPVYIADSSEEIALVADAKTFCKPDLIIECKGRENWFDKGELEQIKSQFHSLNPSLGIYIVSLQSVPEDIQKAMPEGIHILDVGFDEANLELIAQVLTSA